MSILTTGLCPIPLQIPGLLLWYDGNDVNGDGSVIANNTQIETWVDKSGNGFNGTQPIGSQQPTIMTNVQAGKPGLFFVAADEQSFDTDPITLKANVTIFVVLNSTTTNTLSVFDISTVYLPEFNFNSGDNQYGGGNYDGVANRGFAWESAPILTTHVIAYRYDSTNTQLSQMFIDDTTFSPVSNAGVSAVSTGQRRIAGHPAASVWYDGYLFEIMLYQGALTDDQITYLSRYLGNKWGVASL